LTNSIQIKMPSFQNNSCCKVANNCINILLKYSGNLISISHRKWIPLLLIMVFVMVLSVQFVMHIETLLYSTAVGVCMGIRSLNTLHMADCGITVSSYTSYALKNLKLSSFCDGCLYCTWHNEHLGAEVF